MKRCSNKCQYAFISGLSLHVVDLVGHSPLFNHCRFNDKVGSFSWLPAMSIGWACKNKIPWSSFYSALVYRRHSPHGRRVGVSMQLPTAVLKIYDVLLET